MNHLIKTHTLSCRVYYEDTDAGGIVYHANYLKFAERGRTEYLRSVGYDHHAIAKEFDGLLLVVKHIEIDYRAPARLDDMLEIRTTVIACGNTSLTMHQTIYLAEKCVAEMKITIVGITPAGRPVRLPEILRQDFVSQ